MWHCVVMGECISVIHDARQVVTCLWLHENPFCKTKDLIMRGNCPVTYSKSLSDHTGYRLQR